MRAALSAAIAKIKTISDASKDPSLDFHRGLFEAGEACRTLMIARDIDPKAERRSAFNDVLDVMRVHISSDKTGEVLQLLFRIEEDIRQLRAAG
jgi:hypothetical protein